MLLNFLKLGDVVFIKTDSMQCECSAHTIRNQSSSYIRVSDTKPSGVSVSRGDALSVVVNPDLSVVSTGCLSVVPTGDRCPGESCPFVISTGDSCCSSVARKVEKCFSLFCSFSLGLCSGPTGCH